MNLSGVKVILASIVVVAVSVALSFLSPAWLLLSLLPILGIPILRELGLLQDVDERQQLNSYRSSHMAFYSALLFIGIILIEKWLSKGEWSASDFYAVLFMAAAIKLGGVLIMNIPPRGAGLAIASLCGGWWLFFILASAISVYGFEFGTLAAIALIVLPIAIAVGISIWWPRIGGGLMIIAGLTLFYYPIAGYLNTHRIDTLVLMIIAMPLPLILAGTLVFASRWLEKEQVEGARSIGEKTS